MYRLTQLETIAVKFQELLQEAGIEDQQQLLQLGKDRKGREMLANQTSININLINSWVSHADLIRINGIGMEYAELLEKSGVSTVQSLTEFTPEKLLHIIQQVNEQYKLVQHMPNLIHIEAWIEQAKKLPPILER